MNRSKPKNHQNGLTRLVQDVFMTESDEIQCEAASVQMILCAEALLSNAEAQRQYPDLWRHFHFCTNCAEEYELLMELAQQETAGQLERPAKIPALPSKDPSPMRGVQTPAKDSLPVWEQIQEAFKARFPGFRSELAGGLTRGLPADMELVEVTLAEGQITVELGVDNSENNPTLRRLFCIIQAADSKLAARFDGSLVWLQAEGEDAVSQEQTLNELGDATFDEVRPGPYTLGLHLADQVYTIENVVIP
jgi:hypothetical protein